jgi:hypothetical protein
MKTAPLPILFVLAVQMQSLGQGTILFDTHVPGIVDSKWVFYGAPASFYTNFGTDLAIQTGPGQFQRLYPTTTLITSPSSEVGYVEPVTVTAPGYLPGEKVRVSTGLFWLNEPDQIIGSWDTTITLGGGDQPPAYLTGLPSEMFFVPEPSSYALFSATAFGLLLRCITRRLSSGRRRAHRWRYEHSRLGEQGVGTGVAF